MAGMTKAQFLAMFAAMYRVGNRADSTDGKLEDWTKPAMAGKACCALLDQMGRELVACGAVTQDELDEMFANLVY